MKQLPKTSRWMILAFLILLGLALFCDLSAQDCLTGYGYLPDVTEEACVDYSTDTVDPQGIPGKLTFRMTQDSVVYRYKREGFHAHTIAFARTPIGITECHFVHNGILRMNGRKPQD